VDLEPQLARLFVGVQARNVSLEKALAEVSERGKRVKAELAQLGISPKDVQGAGFEIQPIVPSPNPPMPLSMQQSEPSTAVPPQVGAAASIPLASTVTEYRVVSRLQITVQDVARLGQTLSQLTAAGVNRVDQIDCDIRDRAAAFIDSRDRALAVARTRAAQLAKSAQVELGPLLAITDQTPEMNQMAVGMPMPMAQAPGMFQEGRDSIAPLPVQCSRLKFVHVVSVQYAVD
jgi:uncharacterized protein YggE